MIIGTVRIQNRFQEPYYSVSKEKRSITSFTKKSKKLFNDLIFSEDQKGAINIY